MMGFFDSLCGCFSPEVKKNIIDYLSSATLNRQLIEEQKCSEENEAPEQSIYAQVKTKSYYFMKLKEEDEHLKPPEVELTSEPESIDQSLEANYYPHDLPYNSETYDLLYKKKFTTLRRILSEQITHDFSKVYDSQDDLNLKIFCKPQIYQTKRFNAYRFSFDITHSEHRKFLPKDYALLKLKAENQHEPLLNKKTLILKTNEGLEINHRCYKKLLVIQQHEFYAAEKCELLQENKKEVAYNTIFSVKGDWEQAEGHNRGWINLSGIRASVESGDEDHSTSLRESQQHLHFQGYINVDLDITVNSNMLKQPIAKEIRVYVQKLVCSLTETDAI